MRFLLAWLCQTASSQHYTILCEVVGMGTSLLHAEDFKKEVLCIRQLTGGTNAGSVEATSLFYSYMYVTP